MTPAPGSFIVGQEDEKEMTQDKLHPAGCAAVIIIAVVLTIVLKLSWSEFTWVAAGFVGLLAGGLLGGGGSAAIQSWLLKRRLATCPSCGARNSFSESRSHSGSSSIKTLASESHSWTERINRTCKKCGWKWTLEEETTVTE